MASGFDCAAIQNIKSPARVEGKLLQPSQGAYVFIGAVPFEELKIE
jgi:hypothetical protein